MTNSNGMSVYEYYIYKYYFTVERFHREKHAREDICSYTTRYNNTKINTRELAAMNN